MCSLEEGAGDDTPNGSAAERQSRAERTLTEQSKRFLDAIIDNIPNMVFVKDAEHLAFVRFNRAGEELLGVSRSQLIGKTDLDFFPEEQAAFFQAKDRETLSNRVVVDIPEEPIQTPRGPRVLHTKKVPLLDESGTPRYLLGISEDITERKLSEESRSRLAAIVHDSEDAIIGRSLDGLVTSWNRSAERILGYSAAEMLGQPCTRLFPSRLQADEAALTARVAGGARVPSYETVRRQRSGAEIDVSVALSPIRDGAGNLIGVSETARDISQLKQMQRELLRAKEATDAANKELEAFSYSVAHDLRAPLRSIDGFSQALLEDCGPVLGESGQRSLRFVRESAQLMAQLIDDMLTLSRVSRGALRVERVDLSALARATVARLERSHPDRRIEVMIQEGLEGEGDARLLAVVLDNLIGNAWKFTSKSAAPRIELGATGSPSVFFVRDNGAGFDMKYADKLFGIFQRLHSAHEFEGTGVGLATVQRVVNRHGGRVWAEGKVNVGATIYFTLSPPNPDS